VLIIRLRSIGDTVLMTPCLEALHDWRPDIEVAAVSEPLSSPLLKGHPLLDDLIETEKSTWSRMTGIRRMRRWKPDVAFNLHGGTTGMLLARLSGARHSFGFRGHRGSWMLSSPAPGPDEILNRRKIHSVEQQLALLHWAGVPWPEHPRLSLPESVEAARSIRDKLIGLGIAPTSLRNRKFACVVPGAAFESKRWDEVRFSEVVDYLDERWKVRSLVVAGPGQEALARRVAESSRTGAAVVSGIGLNELAEMVRAYACIFVGNDSGAMHIAAAVGCAIVAMFGSSNPDIWHPWTDAAYRVIGGERGTADGNVRASIERVEVQEVKIAIDEVIQLAGVAPSIGSN
jgi:ADP-heptose:LPS heptosyltransferase